MVVVMLPPPPQETAPKTSMQQKNSVGLFTKFFSLSESACQAVYAFIPVPGANVYVKEKIANLFQTARTPFAVTELITSDVQDHPASRSGAAGTKSRRYIDRQP